MQENLKKFITFEVNDRVKIIPGTRFYTGGPEDGNPKDMEGTLFRIEGEWVRVKWDNGKENGYEKHDLEHSGEEKLNTLYYDANKIYLEKEPKDLADIFKILYPKDKVYRSQTTYSKAINADGKLLLQCAEGRMRSFDDLWIIADTYFPNINVIEVFKEMMLFDVTLKDLEDGNVRKQLSNCSTMERIRFTPSRTTLKSIWFSVDCQKYKSIYTWRDLFNMVYVNTFDQFKDWYKAELIARREAEKAKSMLSIKPKIKKAVIITEKTDVIPLKYRSKLIV